MFVESAASDGIVYSVAKGQGPLITLKVEVGQEDDGRWLAEVPGLPGVLAYGDTEPRRSRECKLSPSGSWLNASSMARPALIC